MALSRRATGTEWDAWATVWCEVRRTYRKTRPTRAAVESVFVLALQPDLVVVDPIEIRDDLDEILPPPREIIGRARRMVADAYGTKATLSRALSAAAEALGRSPCLWIGPVFVSEFEPTAGRRLVDTLNRVPSGDALATWYLAPVVRMLCDPGPGPEWLFRYLALMRVARRGRPWLVPRGAPDVSQWSASPDYGWEALEAWVLRVWLREPLTWSATSDRLPAAVQFAIDALRQLARQAPTRGPAALDFEELCRPLRRCLYWYASVPENEPERRRTAQRLLRDLTRAVVPALPPREPIVLDAGHAGLYHTIRWSVGEIWRATRTQGTVLQRQEQLELRHANLTPVPDAATADASPGLHWLYRTQQRFWKDCGDLQDASPAHVARCYVKHFARLDVEPERLKELLASIKLEPPYQRRSVALGRLSWSERGFPPLG